MNELQFLGEKLNKANQHPYGAFDLNESNSISRCLTVLKAKLEKFEQMLGETVKENDFDGPTG